MSNLALFFEKTQKALVERGPEICQHMNKVVRYEVTVPHVADGGAPSPYVHTKTKISRAIKRGASTVQHMVYASMGPDSYEAMPFEIHGQTELGALELKEDHIT